MTPVYAGREDAGEERTGKTHRLVKPEGTASLNVPLDKETQFAPLLGSFITLMKKATAGVW